MNKSQIARMSGATRVSIDNYLSGKKQRHVTVVKIEKALVDYYKAQIRFNMNEIERIEKNNHKLGWMIAKLNTEVL